VIDATMGFWPLVTGTATLSPPQQAATFRSSVIAKFPHLYTARVLGTADGKQLDKEAIAALANARRNNQHARLIEWELAKHISNYAANFQKAFPDFRCDFPIYLMISLGHMDGAGREVNGKPALVLGVDMIDQIESSGQMPVFITHELFHRYHDKAAGFSDDPGDRQPIWRTLWAEGLATYASAKLNPDRPLSDAMIFPPDLAERAAPIIGRLARTLGDNDSPNPKLYARYFEADGLKAGNDPIPPRAGYYVGYRVAELAAQEYSLVELAHLNGKELHRNVDRWLDMLASGPGK
jgi:hypothetical protein